MKILFIVPYVPNLIRVRPYNLIRHLAERGNEVTVLTLQAAAEETEDVENLKKLGPQVIVYDLPRWRSLWNCLRVLPSPRPLQSVYCWQPDMAQGLMALVNQSNGQAPFDVIHVEHLRGVQYALRLKEIGSQIPVVWDSVDCISYLFEQAVAQSKSGLGRLMTRMDLNRTRRFERDVVDLFEQTLVTSPADRDAFLRLRPSTAAIPPITVLANGVDLNTFKPNPEVVRDKATITVTGKMSYHANISMVLLLAREIMPLVWAQRPDAQLKIVGKDPSAAIQKLAELPQVTVTGTVPAIEPYLQQASLSVAPVPYGAGIQNKVLEAMACGTPVIITSKAAAAIAAQPDQDLVLADEPSDFAAKIIDLLNHPDKRRTLGDNGRVYVQTHHDWQEIASNLEKIYKSL